MLDDPAVFSDKSCHRDIFHKIWVVLPISSLDNSENLLYGIMETGRLSPSHHLFQILSYIFTGSQAGNFIEWNDDQQKMIFPYNHHLL